VQSDTSSAQGAGVGAVTFLFTDVEGSTQLLRRLGARRYAGVLAEHDRVLRAAIASHGGEVVDTQGDAVFAAFSEARDAVSAALEAQRAFADWATSGQEAVRVRMGLHTGVPEVANGRYLGLDVHLAARVCAAAHGGQTVVSAAVRDQLGPGAADIAIHELGKHSLKDFETPQGLYQVGGADADLRFPPLRTATSAGDVARFEGREQELAEAAAAAVARAARRSERRRLLAGFAVVVAAAIGAAIIVLTRTQPIRVTPGSVAVIDATTGRIATDVAVGAAPTSMTTGAGAVWVLDTRKDTLTRIDPATHAPQTQGVGGLTSRPTDVAVAHGEIWVVNGFRHTATVLKPSPLALVQRVRLAGDLGVLGTGDAHIADSPSGVWIANGGTGGVSLFTHAHRLKRTIGQASGALAVARGSVWMVAGYGPFGSAGIVRIHEEPPYRATPVPVGEVDAIAAGSGGVWVANAAASTVTRINPATAAVGRPIPVRGGSDVLATGAGYVFAAGPTGVLSRIDPGRNRVDKVVSLGSVRPVSLRVFHGAVYVGVERPRPAPQPAAGLRVVAPPGTVDSVDPAFAGVAASWQMLYATGLNLVGYPDRAGDAGTRLVPDAAARMPQVSNHGHTYTFTVRSGYRFSPPSNQPVTAAGFRAAIERDLRIGDQSPEAAFIPDIVGAAAFESGKSAHPRGIRVRGQTISITVGAAPGTLLPALALPMFAAVPPDTPVSSGPLSTVPSAGPYYVRFDDPGHELILAKNPNYRGPRDATLSAITYRETTRAGWSSVLDGHADYGVGLPPPPPALLATASGSRQIVSGGERTTVDFLALNAHRPLLRRPRARRAINDAIDRPALTATLGPSGGVVTDQYLPPSIHDRIRRHIYPLARPNIVRARRLLAQSGVHLPATAVLYTCTDEGCSERARILADDLRPLRIQLRVRRFSRSDEFLRDIQPGARFDIADEGFVYAINTPAFFLTTGFGYLDTGPYTHRIARAVTLPYKRSEAALGRMSFQLARTYAPLAAFATGAEAEPFSARTACQVDQPVYGIDLTRLCMR
jgi:class 3 adenylate cyclase/ABC-type transport system substrate-binding protein